MTANLSGPVNGYSKSFADFLTYMTTSTNHHGLPMGFPMPADLYADLLTEDLLAIYTYFTGVEPLSGAHDPVGQFPAYGCTIDDDCDALENASGVGGTWSCDTPSGECVRTSGDCTTDHNCSACHTCDWANDAGTRNCLPPAPDAGGCVVDGI